MNDEMSQPPPTSLTANYPLNLLSVRYVAVDPSNESSGRVLVHAIDACLAIGATTEELDTVSTEERVELAIYDGGNLERSVLLTTDGVRQLASLNGDPERSRFVAWVETELSPHRTGHRAPNPNRTKWGWQPIRELVRDRGYTARRFTEEANALNLPVDGFNQGNYIAWAYGGCLPAESLVTRACALLNVEPRDLFNADVLTAYPNRGKGRRRPAREAAGA
jgi:hypothetical protein